MKHWTTSVKRFVEGKASQPVYCDCGGVCDYKLLGDEYWFVCQECGRLNEEPTEPTD